MLSIVEKGVAPFTGDAAVPAGELETLTSMLRYIDPGRLYA